MDTEGPIVDLAKKVGVLPRAVFHLALSSRRLHSSGPQDEVQGVGKGFAATTRRVHQNLTSMVNRLIRTRAAAGTVIKQLLIGQF